MDLASSFNNKGKIFIENGLLEDGYEMFMGALEAIVQATHEAETGERETPVTRQRNRIRCAQEKEDLLSIQIRRKRKKGITTHSQSFLYTKSLLLPSTTEVIIDNDSVTTLYSSVILYNIALSHHLKGTRRSLELAIVFYEKSIHLVADLENEDTENHLIPHLVMALLNNLGQAHYELGNYQISGSYMDRLSHYVLSLDFSLPPSLMEEKEEFLLNGTLLKEPGLAAAA
mmetsp:Transcript_277/g.448  ORF Transcript_277/g.448 Transcript_277/m.448 type:complete len:229 (-) Transcript_277:93-779(-)